MKRRFLALILAGMVTMGAFSGCSSEEEKAPEEAKPAEQVQEEEKEEVKEEKAAYDESKGPVIETLPELRAFLRKSLAEGNSAPAFYYTGEEMLDSATICRIACVAFCNMEYDETTPDLKRAVMEDYPGARMLKAHASGDFSILNEEEKQALDIAVQVVEEAKAEAESDLMLELALHDWLCEKVTYDDSTRSVFSADYIPPNLTAVGALLNGAANCQGYTDAFYVLGTLAGFNVDRQYCRGLNQGDFHVTNNIEINGKWSIVDVTYDDNSIRLGEEIRPDRHLFNAGLDIVNQEYEWPEEYQHHPIEGVTTEDYFYFTEENEKYHGFGSAYTTVEEMAKGIVNEWKATGRTEFYTMLDGKNADYSELLDAVIKEIEASGRTAELFVTSSPKGENSFFTVSFAQ